MRFGNQRPSVVLAWGGAAGLALIGLGLLLSLVIIALSMVGTIIGGGLVGSAAAPWLIPAASAGIAIGGGAGGLVVLVRVIKMASSRPYEWIIPVLSILSAFIVDLGKELYQGDQVTKIAFGAITAAVFFVGGLLWMRKGFIAKFLAAVMYLFPPCLVLVKSIQMQHRSIGAAVAEIPADIWITIGGLLLILVMVGALSYILKRGNVDSQ